MSKIFRLREWLTVPEAAKQLSISFGEEVTEADVLRLALDGRLRLSVYFVNHGKARCGKVIPWEETDWLLFPRLDKFPCVKAVTTARQEIEGRPCPPKLEALFNELPPDEWGKFHPLMRGLSIDRERFLKLSDTVTTLDGVWDLPMIGAERLDVEHQFQNLTGGPEVTLINLDGAFVEGPEGTICQLQEDFDDSGYQPGSLAALDELKQRIAVEEIKPKEAETLLALHGEQRKKFLEERKGKPEKDRYFPAGGLPRDIVLVIRTEALRKFERAVDGTVSGPETKSAPCPRASANASNKLMKMNQASAKFWTNADRDERGTQPDNATVAAWLVQQGFSQTLADKAATLIRPEWAPTGRKPEE